MKPATDPEREAAPDEPMALLQGGSHQTTCDIELAPMSQCRATYSYHKDQFMPWSGFRVLVEVSHG